MSAFETLTRETPPVSTVRTIGGLSAIRHRGCGAVIWNRHDVSRLATWLEGLVPNQLPNVRTILVPENAARVVHAVFDDARTPDCAERDDLIDDIVSAVATFADVMQAPKILMRLEVVADNACKKFHMDRVRARFICTYRGTGTEYGLSMAGEQPEEPLRVSTGSALLVRGTEWKNDLSTLVLHRSPQIADSGETRFLLVLDAIDDPEDSWE